MIIGIVTPFVGVWIETGSHNTNKVNQMSHPSWVCGLKHYLVVFLVVITPSHPSWVCGLKQQNEWSLNKLMEVTPFVGVWIET